MYHQIVLFTIGFLLLTLGCAEIVPLYFDLHDGDPNANAFAWSCLICLFTGGGLCLGNRSFQKHLGARQVFLLTTICWLVVSFFSSLPLYLSTLDLSFTDAFFEALSGVTTTGSTVLSGLDHMSRGILIWRALMQWIGGIGIIAFVIVLLPYLKVGGMQLFKAESSDRSDKAMPKTRDIVWSLIQVYAGLTAACFVTYALLGMSWFDALTHAMTTIPTGGYANYDASFGHFGSYGLDMAATFFMLLSGLPFVLYVKLVFQGQFRFHKDAQVRGLVALLFAIIGILTFSLWADGQYSLADSFRYSSFNIVSIITTTGYATTDYSLWGAFAGSLFFFVTYIGACAGSTTGGAKTIRLMVALATLKNQMARLIYPNGVFTVHYQNKPLEPDVMQSVMGFLFLYVVANTVLTLALTLTGLDFTTAITGAATALANVGPGLGDTIGPAGNFAALNDTAKWLLCLGMLLGRLEVMTVLVLLTPQFWQG